MSSPISSAPRFNWADTFPWLIIFRSLSVACSATILLFALIGVVATPMGWIVSERVFLGSEEYLNSHPILAEIAEINRSPYRGVFLATESDQNAITLLGQKLSGPKLVFEQTIKPFYAIFGSANTSREFLYFLCGSLWSMVVWAFVGLGITRVSLLRYTRNEHAGLDDAFDYAVDYFPTCLAALALPIGFAFLLCIPTFLIGLMMGFDLGALLVGIFWFVVLGIALLLGILLLGLMVSWPLVVSSVAAEGQNAFDAITRAFAYVFQRPVHYLFYAMIAVVFGGVCWLVVHEFTDSVVRLSYWSTSWGANRTGADRIEQFKTPPLKLAPPRIRPENLISRFAPATPQEFTPNQDAQQQPIETDGIVVGNPQQPDVGHVTTTIEMPEFADDFEQVASIPQESGSLKTARSLIHFWSAFAKTVAAAFIHGLFWCMASAIYLLLRKDLDETEMDEIFMIDERRTYELPPLQSDEHGIPQVQPIAVEESASGEDQS